MWLLNQWPSNLQLPHSTYGQTRSPVSGSLTVKLGRGQWLNGWWFYGRPTTWTPELPHRSGTVATYGPLVIFLSTTFAVLIENSFSDCTVLQMEGGVNQYTHGSMFPRDVMYARCWVAQTVVAIDNSSQSGSPLPADDALDNVVISGTDRPYVP